MLVTIESRTISCCRERLCEECIVWVFFIHKSVIVTKSKILETNKTWVLVRQKLCMRLAVAIFIAFR